jgi:hypothetical protein
MPVNEIKQFCPDGTVANGDVMDLAAYEAEAQRLTGNQAGIARRDLVNTVLRQCSHMAAGLAQFIANRTTDGVVDDGDLDKIEAGLLSAIAGIVSDLIAATNTRVPLVNDLTLYVSPAGDDGNSGLTPTEALATPQAAWNLLATTYDLRGYTATIQLAAGTYTTGLLVTARVVGQTSVRGVRILGDTATPANVILEPSLGPAMEASTAGCFYVSGVKITSPTSNGLFASMGGQIEFGNIVFGACSGSHITSLGRGIVSCAANYEIVDGATSHCSSQIGGLCYINSNTITLTGSPAFSSFAAVAFDGLIYCPNITFYGDATGARYSIGLGANSIYTNSGMATYLPGDSEGVNSGGTYV